MINFGEERTQASCERDQQDRTRDRSNSTPAANDQTRTPSGSLAKRNGIIRPSTPRMRRLHRCSAGWLNTHSQYLAPRCGLLRPCVPGLPCDPNQRVSAWEGRDVQVQGPRLIESATSRHRPLHPPALASGESQSSCEAVETLLSVRAQTRNTDPPCSEERITR